jgi:hypothetical protein
MQVVFFALIPKRQVHSRSDCFPDFLGLAAAAIRKHNEVQFFSEDDLPALLHELKSADLVMGYDLANFAFRVLGGYAGVDLNGIRYWDAAEELRSRTGQSFPLEEVETACIGGINPRKPPARKIDWPYYATTPRDWFAKLCRLELTRVHRLTIYAAISQRINYFDVGSEKTMFIETQSPFESSGEVIRTYQLWTPAQLPGKTVLFALLPQLENRRGLGDFLELWRVAVAVVRDATGDTVFYEEDLPRLVQVLKAANLVIGWRLMDFDFKVLRGYRYLDLTGIRYFEIEPDLERRAGRELRSELERALLDPPDHERPISYAYDNRRRPWFAQSCRATLACIQRTLATGISSGNAEIYFPPTERIPVDWRAQALPFSGTYRDERKDRVMLVSMLATDFDPVTAVAQQMEQCQSHRADYHDFVEKVPLIRPRLLIIDLLPLGENLEEIRLRLAKVERNPAASNLSIVLLSEIHDDERDGIPRLWGYRVFGAATRPEEWVRIIQERVEPPDPWIELSTCFFPGSPRGPSSFGVRRDRLIYEGTGDSNVPESHLRAFEPTSAQWRRFASVCDEIDIWALPFHMDDQGIVDGMYYVLNLRIGLRVLNSSGQLCFAPEAHVKRVQRFLGSLQEMIGHQPDSQSFSGPYAEDHELVGRGFRLRPQG